MIGNYLNRTVRPLPSKNFGKLNNSTFIGKVQPFKPLSRNFAENTAIQTQKKRDRNFGYSNTMWPFNDMLDVVSDFRRPFLVDFEDFFGPNIQKASKEWRPRADIVETGESYNIHAELPGVAKENVKVSLEENVLTLQGERKSEFSEDDKERKFHRRERMQGSFIRKFSLPEEVDPKNVKAHFKDGVLELTVPKVHKQQKEAIPINIE